MVCPGGKQTLWIGNGGIATNSSGILRVVSGQAKCSTLLELTPISLQMTGFGTDDEGEIESGVMNSERKLLGCE